MRDTLDAKARKREERLRREVAAYLDAGERIEATFVSQTGPSPRGLLSLGVTSNLIRYWTVAITDRGVVVCPFGRRGKARRLPRAPFEVLEDKGRRMWFPVRIADEVHWVSREQYDVVAEANELLRHEPAASAPGTDGSAVPTAVGPTAAADWYPDPTGRHQMRYWDGRTWTGHVADQGAPGSDPIS